MKQVLRARENRAEVVYMCLLSGLVGCFSLIWRERLVVGSLSAQVVEITLVTWLVSLFVPHSPLC